MKLTILILVFLIGLVVTPAFAQEGDPRNRHLTFDDFSLTFHRVIARNVGITEYAGDSPEIGPGFSDAPHYAVTLYNDTNLPDSLFDTIVSIRVYSLTDLQDYSFLMEQVDALKALLDERPDLAEYLTVEAIENNQQLPFIPTLPHGQLIRARAHYVETDEVQGIAYITYSNAAREPFLSNQFSYTFQGLSTDGEYYISASMPLTTSLFPAELEGFDPVAFEAEWPEYLVESIASLNEAAPEDFEPALGVLDGLIETFAFAG
jgi:hypothetical protein